MSLVEKEVVSVKGKRTELLSVHPKERGDLTIVIIPGNPGIIDFYIEFMEEIYTRSEGRYSVLAIGHAGHCAEDLNAGQVFSLQDQIQHKVDFLSEMDGRFVLIGHSVGSYICLQVAKRLPDHHICQIINLFPTVHSLHQGLPFPVKIFMRPVLRQILGWMLHYVPLSLKRWILNSRPQYTQTIRTLVSTLLNYHTVQNVLYMAYRESLEICALDDSLLDHTDRRVSPRLIFLYGRTDRYTPLEFYEDMKTRIKDDVHLADDGIEHAFVLQHSVPVAHKVIEFLSYLEENEVNELIIEENDEQLQHTAE
jgi:pimeloyl-ACP methyl ester carboxylesterase